MVLFDFYIGFVVHQVFVYELSIARFRPERKGANRPPRYGKPPTHALSSSL
jgi:hypothetical protein